MCLVRIIQALAYMSFLIGFLILLDQYYNSGVWFQLADIHHETLAIGFFSLGIGILLGLTWRNRKI